MLKPLEQFICDKCGHVIRSKAEGWIEWRSLVNPRRVKGFKIVHHSAYSPLGGREGCYHYGNNPDRSDEHLNQFADSSVVYNLLHFMDSILLHGPELKVGEAIDLHEWSELVKRLLLPYYEEARLYIEQARENDFIDDLGNPHHLYSAPVLKRIAEHYSQYNLA
jgi:hypothetical protein